jgi:hypothetical protein
MRPYTRKISAEEAKEGYILVSKDRLKDFPPVGEDFILIADAAEGEARVDAYRCTCRGPRQVHEHWFIRPGVPLHRGDEATLTQTVEDPPAFSLMVKHPWSPK